MPYGFTELISLSANLDFPKRKIRTTEMVVQRSSIVG